MRRSFPSPVLLVTILTLLLVGSSCSKDSTAGEQVPASEAHKYIGQYKTIYGTVVATRYAAESRGQPTFLNFEKPYPNHVFGVVIWGLDRSKFGTPPDSAFLGKQVHVTGLIEKYEGKPQILVTDPGQIVIRSQVPKDPGACEPAAERPSPAG